MGGERTRRFLKVDGKVTETTLGTKVETMEGVSRTLRLRLFLKSLSLDMIKKHVIVG